MSEPNSIRSLPERAAQAGISISTLHRLIASGQGPVVTEVSTRRRGISDQHWNEWVKSRPVRGPREAAE